MGFWDTVADTAGQAALDAARRGAFGSDARRVVDVVIPQPPPVSAPQPSLPLDPQRTIAAPTPAVAGFSLPAWAIPVGAVAVVGLVIFAIARR